MGGWQELANILLNVPNGSLESIVLSGHGAAGGVQTADGMHMGPQNLPPDIAQLIEDKLTNEGTVIVLGCNQADSDRAEHMQALADVLGHSVVGNTGTVSSGTHGDGTWIEIAPQPNTPSGRYTLLAPSHQMR
ncbi:MAG: DUF4347 domain-containing protein [Pirellulaceae bacterium]